MCPPKWGRGDKCSLRAEAKISPLRSCFRGHFCACMKHAPYSELLKDPRWQKKRLKVLEYAQWRCQFCGSKDRTLHVHHSYYTRGKMPWQYPEGSLVALCDSCHEKLHPERKEPPARYSPPIECVPVEHQSSASRFAAMKKLLMEGD
jgi:hypothetical protein